MLIESFIGDLNYFRKQNTFLNKVIEFEHL